MIKLVPYEPEQHAKILYNWFYDSRYRNAFRTLNSLLKLKDFENIEQICGCNILMILDDQAVIGFGRFTMRTGTTAVVGIMVTEEHQRQGKALTAMQEGIRFLKERGVHKIVARARETDKRLIEIMKKIGFVVGFTDLHEFMEHDKWVNEVELYYL